MAREENLLILKMLQDGTISAEQAAELLNALDVSESRSVTPPVPPVPPTPGSVPMPPPSEASFDTHDDDAEGEAFSRARARIAAARERVAGVQEKLTAAEERLVHAKESPNPWESVADALKDIPGARSVADALRGVDPGRIAASARRQARRVARQVRSSIGDLNLDIHLNFGEHMQGEPTLSSPREVTAPIPAGGTLRVRNTLGDIEAQGADVPEARIAGLLKVWAADEAAARVIADQIVLVVEEGADGPTISVRHPDRQRKVALDLKVFVPRENGPKVSLMSPSGDISARDIKGTVVLATQSGDARAAEIAGDVAAETASGDIGIEGVIGNVTASSASGDITAYRMTGQSLRASTQSGDVTVGDATIPVVTVETVSGDASLKSATVRTLRIRAVSGDIEATSSTFEGEAHLDTVSGYVSFAPGGPVSSGTFSLVTVSGDIEVNLPKATHASFDVSTKSGDVDGRVMGADGVEKTFGVSGMVRVNEVIGSGAGARITVSTMSGDVKVRQESPVVEIQ